MKNKPIELLMVEFKENLLNIINSDEFIDMPLIIKRMCFNEVKDVLDNVTDRNIKQIIQRYNSENKEE